MKKKLEKIVGNKKIFTFAAPIQYELENIGNDIVKRNLKSLTVIGS